MKKFLPVIIAAVVVGGLAFFGGFKYGQSLQAQTRGQFRGQNGMFAGMGAGRRGTGQFAAGSILSKDDKSITLKLADGSSKIIFVSSSTPVMKSAPGSLTDLTVGDSIVVTGSPNSDGSITAQSVQIRPAAGNQVQ